jgi:hypothetical protein
MMKAQARCIENRLRLSTQSNLQVIPDAPWCPGIGLVQVLKNIILYLQSGRDRSHSSHFRAHCESKSPFKGKRQCESTWIILAVLLVVFGAPS